MKFVGLDIFLNYFVTLADTIALAVISYQHYCQQPEIITRHKSTCCFDVPVQLSTKRLALVRRTKFVIRLEFDA